MLNLPDTGDPLLVRTDFSDERAWQETIAAATRESPEGFRANLHIVDDPAFGGAPGEALATAASSASGHAVLFVADAATIGGGEHDILCIDLRSGRSFRVVPSEMWAVENNLSLANMDFEDFADAVDPDGVFRGFPAV